MKKENQTTTRRWQRGVVLFLCLLVGSGIILVAIRTMRVKSSGIPVVQPIRIPRYLPGAPQPGWPGGDDAKELVAIASFQKWMDSLRNDSLGKRRYESILRIRPGLLDSARNAAHYYFLHQLLQ